MQETALAGIPFATSGRVWMKSVAGKLILDHNGIQNDGGNLISTILTLSGFHILCEFHTSLPFLRLISTFCVVLYVVLLTYCLIYRMWIHKILNFTFFFSTPEAFCMQGRQFLPTLKLLCYTN